MWSKESPVKKIAIHDVSYETLSCDVLIVGTGGAGLRAAIESFDGGASTLVISKTLMGKAHAVMAEGGIAAALGNVDPKDSWKVHFSDTNSRGQEHQRLEDGRDLSRRRSSRGYTSSSGLASSSTGLKTGT